MIEKRTVIISNKTGLHARPASQFVQKAGQFSSDVSIIFKDKEVNAKSIMGVLSLGISQGSEIVIKSEGDDADTAVEELVNFIEEELAKEDEE